MIPKICAECRHFRRQQNGVRNYCTDFRESITGPLASDCPKRGEGRPRRRADCEGCVHLIGYGDGGYCAAYQARLATLTDCDRRKEERDDERS